MAIDMEKLRARLAKVNNKAKEGWWKLKEGEERTIRILPTQDEDPIKDYYFHYNMGKHSGFLCPKRNFDEDCAVCEFASEMWNNGNDEEKELAKKLFVRQRFFSAVIEREGENGLKSKEPKIWGYSKTVYEAITGLIMDEDYGDITSVTKGHDLKVKCAKNEKQRFATTTVKARPLKTSLCEELTEKECNEILEKIPNFEDLMLRKTSEEVENILAKWSNEGTGESDKEMNEEEGVDYKEEKKAEAVNEEEKKTEKKENKKKKDKKSDNPVDKAFDELLSD